MAGGAGPGTHPDHLLALHHTEAAGRHVAGTERAALAVRRARRLERWACRIRRMSDRLYQAARVRLARIT